MSLEWLSTLSYRGIRPFKKRASPLVTSGQQISLSLQWREFQQLRWISWWLFNWQMFLVWVCLLALPKLKGIVHPKMKMWCLSAYLQGIQDVGDFVSSVEHKQRFLTRTVAVCQSYNGSQWYSRLWERKKHRQNQIKPCSSWRYIEV